MIAFLKRRRATANQEALWAETSKVEAKLHARWGLGRGQQGPGYRRRLKSLCRFLLALEPDGGKELDGKSRFEKLQRVMARPGERTAAEKDAEVLRLEDLRDALGALRRRSGEEIPHCLTRLREHRRIYGARQETLRSVLAELRVLPKMSNDTLPLEILWELWSRLAHLEAASADPLRLQAARNRWQECFDDLLADWQWAYLQILIRLARECLAEKPSSPRCCAKAIQAGSSLGEAIRDLESRGFLQPRAQGLYGLLAQAALLRAKAAATPPKDRPKQIEVALAYARLAVAMEPESARERLVLLEVLATTGDFAEMEIVAEVTLNLDSGPQTLRTVGASFWQYAATLRARGARRRFLRKAADFFAGALAQVESAPFDESSPLEQMQSHGWAHFWLGRFQCERGKFAQAIAHLRTASELGFKPLESRVELAWAFLLARDRKEGDLAFARAVAEIHRRTAARGKISPEQVAPEPGEERTIADLDFDVYLGWSLLCADWNPDRALANLGQARELLELIDRPDTGELTAVLYEAHGRARLGKQDVSGAVQELEEAVRQGIGTGACCYLGLASVAQAEADAQAAPAALRRAREAYRLARETNFRGRYSREIWELRRQLRKLDPSAAQAAHPPASPSATSPPQSKM